MWNPGGARGARQILQVDLWVIRRRRNSLGKTAPLRIRSLDILQRRRWRGDCPTWKWRFRGFSLFWCKSVVLGPLKGISRLLAGWPCSYKKSKRSSTKARDILTSYI